MVFFCFLITYENHDQIIQMAESTLPSRPFMADFEEWMTDSDVPLHRDPASQQNRP